VLCLHSFPDHPIGLLALAERLADGGREAVVAGLPGWPPSTPVSDGDYSIAAVAGDLVETMGALGHERFAVVGHGWGAELGYHLAAHRPERVEALVALAVPHPAGWRVRHTTFNEQRTAAYALFLAYSPRAPQVASERRWLTAAFQHWCPGLHREDWEEVLDLIAHPHVLEIVARYYRINLESDAPPVPIGVPTTTIHGGQSPVVRPALFEGLAPWFTAGYRRHLIPHVGQWPQLEAPELVTPLVLAGLREPPRVVEEGA
ncbi:MAG: alpha/beta hydrolase, partial [Conexibacter sp.]